MRKPSRLKHQAERNGTGFEIRDPSLIAPAKEPYAPKGVNLSELRGDERRAAWDEMQTRCPEFARIVTDFSQVFGKPEAVRIDYTPQGASPCQP